MSRDHPQSNATPPPLAAGESTGAASSPDPTSAADRPARVLVVDDHPFFRAGALAWLRRQRGLVPCGQAGSAPDARRAVVTLDPDVVLLDLRLAAVDGLDLLRELLELRPRLRIVVLSRLDEDAYAHRALRAGARGYVMKSEATEVLLAAIRTVLRGGIHLSRRAAARLTQNLFPDPAESNTDLARLSDRELQVFRLLGTGSGVAEIAATLKISPRTVETHRERLKAKLGAPNASALLRLATGWVQQGCLPSPHPPGAV